MHDKLSGMTLLTPEAVEVLTTGARDAHLVTLNEDGSPQVTLVWTGIEDGEIVCAHLGMWKKVRNVIRDGRVALSVEADGVNPIGLNNYLVVEGTARVTEGGAPELLAELAKRYLGPDVKFPPMDDPPAGFITRITPTKVGGVGPWSDR